MKIATIRLPEEEYEKLREEAEDHDNSLSEYLQRIVLQRDSVALSKDDRTTAKLKRRRKQRKKAARAVLEYLRQEGEATPEDFRKDVEPNTPIDGASPADWWKRAAKPAIDRARDAGLVEFVEGYDVYWWIGDDAVDESASSRTDVKTPITDALAGTSVDVDAILGGEDDVLQARREALEAALHSIAVSGPTTREELRNRIYPYYSAGHDSKVEWCEESIAPALNALHHASDLLTREGDHWRLSDSADPTTLIRTAENTYQYS